MTPDDCIQAARNLAPLLREKARDAEIARRPLGAVGCSGILTAVDTATTSSPPASDTPETKASDPT